MATLEAQPRTDSPNEFENPKTRVAAYNFVTPFAFSFVLFQVMALFVVPANLRLLVMGLGFVWTGISLAWAIWWARVLAWRVQITASGLEFTHAWGPPSRVTWPDIERLRQQGKQLFVYRRAGRQVRISDDGAFAQRVIETARRCGVTIDPPKPA